MAEKATSRIVVVGSANIDFIMQVPHLPTLGETVVGNRFTQAFGGKGANQAVAAARAGGRVTLLCSLGIDNFSEQMYQSFQKDGLDTSYIIRKKGSSCGTALIFIDPQGNNCIAVDPGANALISVEDIEVLDSLLTDAALLLLQYEIPSKTLARAIEIAVSRGVRIVWNFAPAHPYPFMDQFTQVNLLLVNETEAAFLAGMQPPEQNAEVEEALYRIHALGAETIILTRGKAGSSLLYEGKVNHIEAFPVKAVDSTAAGDVYCGTLAVALAEGKDLTEAVRFASAASAISVTRLGAQPSAPKREEIEVLLREKRI
ncbi:MAG: ribokinase [Spirochaetales bacterium]